MANSNQTVATGQAGENRPIHRFISDADVAAIVVALSNVHSETAASGNTGAPPLEALRTLYQAILDALDDQFAPATCRRLDDALDAARAVLGRAAQ